MSERLDAIKARYDAAWQMVSDLCSGKQRWTMRVPADEKRDADLVIGNALQDIPYLLEQLQAAEADATRLADALEDAYAEIGGCSPTSGGTDGQWCVAHHDYRWVEGGCELTAAVGAALDTHDERVKP